MTKIKIESLVWNTRNIVHIRKHSVLKSEVETVVSSLIYHIRTHSGRYLVVGRSGRRTLSVILSRKRAKTYYVVTARDSSKKERRKLNEKQNL